MGLVDRTIFELLTVRRGAGMTVKDLRTAEEMEVRERTFSNHASAGMLVCARAVPDGDEHQFLGGLFNVRTGTEAALLDLLDEADPEAIAALGSGPRSSSRAPHPGKRTQHHVQGRHRGPGRAKERAGSSTRITKLVQAGVGTSCSNWSQMSTSSERLCDWRVRD